MILQCNMLIAQEAFIQIKYIKQNTVELFIQIKIIKKTKHYWIVQFLMTVENIAKFHIWTQTVLWFSLPKSKSNLYWFSNYTSTIYKIYICKIAKDVRHGLPISSSSILQFAEQYLSPARKIQIKEAYLSKGKYLRSVWKITEHDTLKMKINIIKCYNAKIEILNSKHNF